METNLDNIVDGVLGEKKPINVKEVKVVLKSVK